MTNMLLTLAVLLPAAPVPAPKDTTPKGLPPQVVMVSALSYNTLELLQITQRLVPRRVRAVQAGQQVVKTIEVPVPEQQIFRVSLDEKGVQVYRADGKKVDPKDVPKLVKKPVAALLSTGGKPVDPFYLRLAREGTLVFVIPAALHHPPPADKVDPPLGKKPRLKK